MGIDITGYSRLERRAIPPEHRATRFVRPPFDVHQCILDEVRAGKSAADAHGLLALSLAMLGGVLPPQAPGSKLPRFVPLPPEVTVSDAAGEWQNSVPDAVAWDWAADAYYVKTADTRSAYMGRSYSGHSDWGKSLRAAAAACGVPCTIEHSCDEVVTDGAKLAAWRDELAAIWPTWRVAHATQCSDCKGEEPPQRLADVPVSMPLMFATEQAQAQAQAQTQAQQAPCWEVQVYASLAAAFTLAADGGVLRIS